MLDLCLHGRISSSSVLMGASKCLVALLGAGNHPSGRFDRMTTLAPRANSGGTSAPLVVNFTTTSVTSIVTPTVRVTVLRNKDELNISSPLTTQALWPVTLTSSPPAKMTGAQSTIAVPTHAQSNTHTQNKGCVHKLSPSLPLILALSYAVWCAPPTWL